eukprot:3952602-Pleurochrysis_carterae.AAC.1
MRVRVRACVCVCGCGCGCGACACARMRVNEGVLAWRTCKLADGGTVCCAGLSLHRSLVHALQDGGHPEADECAVVVEVLPDSWAHGRAKRRMREVERATAGSKKRE